MSEKENLKVAIVTGAARGIGFEIAQRFHSEKYHVIILDYNKEALAACKERLKGKKRYSYFYCDISKPQQIQKVCDQISKKFEAVHALVNNAGIAIFKRAQEVSIEEWNQVININLSGTFYCSQLFYPLLKAGQGAIVNIASISGVRASTLRIAYGTSKAAIMHLTKQQAVEYGNEGVRVNAVAPGPVETEMAKLVHSADIRTAYADAIPLARYGTTTEISNAVYFLCSPEASYINGQILAVDGGFDAAGVGLPSLRN